MFFTSHLNVLVVMLQACAPGNAVALVEKEIRAEHVLVEPHLGKRVQEAFVVVIGHSTSILDLADHVPHGVPGHAL